MPSERRLHPSSFLFTLGASVRSFVLPGLFLLAVTGNRFLGFLLMLAVIPYGIYGLFRYWTYRYSFAETDLVIRSGLFFRNERHIPYERIHNIGVVRNLFHRMLGVVEARLETAGGKEPEAKIQVLSVAAMEELRSLVFRHKQAGQVAADGEQEAAEEPKPAQLLHLPLRELVVYGIIDNRGMIFVGAAFGLLWELQWESMQGYLGRFGSFIGKAGKASTPLQVAIVAALLFLAFVVLLRLFSISWAVLKLYGFRLHRAGRDLTMEAGLLTRVSTTIPLHRIQMLTIREKPMHRWFGRAEVEVESAGGWGEGENQTAKPQQRLAPLIRRQELGGLVREVYPEVDLEAIDWQRVDPRARRRILRRALLIILLAALPLSWLMGAWVLVPLAVVVPLGVLNAVQQARTMGYARLEGVVAYRSGWIWRNWSIVRLSKIQAVALNESPFDRRYRMAQLRVDTASARTLSHRVRIPYLDGSVARCLFQDLAAQAAHTTFRW
jgi:putative membrane protein